MDQQKKIRNRSNLPFFGYQLVVFFAQIFILIACIEYMNIIYNNDILPDKLVKENYPQTTCTIVTKKLSEIGRVVHRYRADFLVSYLVKDNPYRDWVTGNGLDQSFFRDRAKQQDTLDQYEVGLSYPCWYNPDTPQIAVLVLRHDWASTLPLAIPSIIGLVAIYYIIKGILQFLGGISVAIQNRKRYK